MKYRKKLSFVFIQSKTSADCFFSVVKSEFWWFCEQKQTSFNHMGTDTVLVPFVLSC